MLYKITLTLPVKMGGLGIRDPTQIWPACLLANTSSMESTALLLGGEAEFLRTMQNIAITLYCQAVECLPSALTIPKVDVQRKLLEPLQRKQLDRNSTSPQEQIEFPKLATNWMLL